MTKSHFPIDFLTIHSMTASFSLEELRYHLPPYPFRGKSKPIQLNCLNDDERNWVGSAMAWHGKYRVDIIKILGLQDKKT
jgi:hypothetical protein